MRLLAVPIQIDALCLTADTEAAGPAADFTRLPYVDSSGRDVNEELPYLSDVTLPTPFETRGIQLRAGVHLHWSLPDALTRPVDDGPDGQFHRVPNRWLVTRAPVQGLWPDRQWIVESDALSDDNLAAVRYPILPPDPASPTGRPYRYLGRRTPLDEWSGPATERLRRLTAIGYGEPTFAAFYPNAHSVFGFHDPDHTNGPPAGWSYHVLGWFSDDTLDTETDLAQLLSGANPATGPRWQDLLAATRGWSAPDDEASIPARLIFVGCVWFPRADPPPPAPEPGITGVYLANTATETLAAHLGQVLPTASEDEIAHLLEALPSAGLLENAALDLPTRLADARHQDSFQPAPAGLTWTVRRPAAADPADTTPALPASLGPALAALNRAQTALDRTTHRVTGLRQQLFADWHRYLTCAYPPEDNRDGYPDPDVVAVLLDQEITEINQLAALTASGGTLTQRRDAAASAVQGILDGLNTDPTDPAFVLQAAPGQPFYQPNDPVVLLAGPAARPSDRWGTDGSALACDVIAAPATFDGFTSGSQLGTLGAHFAAWAMTQPSTHPARRMWDGQPWHPLLLHWEAEFFPTRYGNNLGPADHSYDSDFITSNYVFPDEDVDLVPAPGRALVERGTNAYRGSTILSASAHTALADRVLRYIQGGPLAEYNDAQGEAGLPTLTPEEFRAAPEAVLTWLRGHSERRLRLIGEVYDRLLTEERQTLSQSLGGFNDALIMQRLIRQLPIADPLGFSAGQALAARVAAAVAGESWHSPCPGSGFNPIRAGRLRLRRLSLSDSFGLPHPVDPQTFFWQASGLRPAGHPDWVSLPPRLVQPARISADLLDAGSDLTRCDWLPNSSAVCGWLLPDSLDNTIRVYTAAGEWLGTLCPAADPVQPSQARWIAAPLTGGSVDGINNRHLRRVVAQLRDGGGARLDAVLDGLVAAGENVEPEEPGQHHVRSVLLGRPVAVVRLAIDLELLEPPAVNQDWSVFRRDLRRGIRESDGFEQVRFPVRIGDHGRLGDGVLGFWLDDDPTQTFRAVADPTGLGIDQTIQLTVDARATTLTVLLEPAGAMHVVSGVLPSHSVRLPMERYQEALGRLQTSFLAAPVLTEAGSVDVLAPGDPGGAWFWREYQGSIPVETPLTTDSPGASLETSTQLTAREGWLVRRPSS